jgi:hypothetical protein
MAMSSRPKDAIEKIPGVMTTRPIANVSMQLKIGFLENR